MHAAAGGLSLLYVPLLIRSGVSISGFATTAAGKTASFRRQPPAVARLLAVLDSHDVLYVVTGSSAALLHGVALTPGHLDVTPALDTGNLERLARALVELDASQYPDEPFGRWKPAKWRAPLGRLRADSR